MVAAGVDRDYSPHIPFLLAYPFPAFVLPLVASTLNGGPSLTPLFANPALHALLNGHSAWAPADLAASFRPALGSVAQARRFTEWAFAQPLTSHTPPCTNTFALELELPWLPPDAEPVRLDVVQTRVADTLICTTVPRTALPDLLPSPPLSAASSPPSGRLKANLRLSDLPHGLPRASSGPAALSHAEASAAKAGMSCVELCNTHDWASTSLGPRSEWSDTLCASVSYVLGNPFPVRAPFCAPIMRAGAKSGVRGA
jgi:hypothetical protein